MPLPDKAFCIRRALSSTGEIICDYQPHRCFLAQSPPLRGPPAGHTDPSMSSRQSICEQEASAKRQSAVPVRFRIGRRGWGTREGDPGPLFTGTWEGEDRCIVKSFTEGLAASISAPYAHLELRLPPPRQCIAAAVTLQLWPAARRPRGLLYPGRSACSRHSHLSCTVCRRIQSFARVVIVSSANLWS